MDSSLSLSKLLSQNGLAKEVEGEQAFHDLGLVSQWAPHCLGLSLLSLSGLSANYHHLVS